MSLLDEARAAQRPNGSECGVATVRGRLAAPLLTDFDDLLEAINAKSVHATSASTVLKLHEILLSADTLSRHVRRRCQCP